MSEVSTELARILAVTMVAYVIVMYAISYWAQRQVKDEEDFLVAGRRLPLSLAWMTLLATWFGAGTMITVAEEVRDEGVHKSGLDPVGAGVCLLLAGFFLAGPMWRLKILTIPDLFRRRYGRVAEVMASLIMVPSYFGWIATQFSALAGLLHLYFDIPFPVGVIVVSLVGAGYTMMGGMWSVTLTDAVQVGRLMLGLGILLFATLMQLGDGSFLDGWSVLIAKTPAVDLHLIPRENWPEFAEWCGLFAAGAFGNLAAQDLMQRVFASRSELVARRACLIAGGFYLLFGAIPVILGLVSRQLLPESMKAALLPALATLFLHPVFSVIFVVTLLSAVLSTIDSALLSPASIISHNLMSEVTLVSRLMLNRLAVALIAACSTVLALLGKNAYELLSASYEMTLVGLVVPMICGLYRPRTDGRAALLSMVVGIGIWGWHLALGWSVFAQPLEIVSRLAIPPSIAATLCATVVLWMYPLRPELAESVAT